MKSTEHIETVIVGGGQAGLAVGYELKRRRLPFVILDAGAKTGDSWRQRWDSMRLFTPARFDGLSGLRFSGSGSHYPTKDAVADYLEAYAARFDLPIRNDTRVLRLFKRDGTFVLETADTTLEADHVVVAMARYQKPRVPDFAKELRQDILQLHSLQYRNPSQLRKGPVLIVGAGNSGADIGLELAGSRAVWMAVGTDHKEVPFRIESTFGRLLGLRMVRWFGHHVLNLGTPLGRKLRPSMMHGGPLVRVKKRDLAKAGVQRVARLTRVRDGRPELADGRVLDVPNVIWCTGFRSGFSSWIDLPDLGDLEHDPAQRRGIVENQPGLYFVGLHFMFGITSGLLTGVSRDARYVVRALDALRSARSCPPERAAS